MIVLTLARTPNKIMITTESIIIHESSYVSVLLLPEIKKGGINEHTISASIIFLQIVTIDLLYLLELADHSI